LTQVDAAGVHRPFRIFSHDIPYSQFPAGAAAYHIVLGVTPPSLTTPGGGKT
jgi:hypothetical protein